MTASGYTGNPPGSGGGGGSVAWTDVTGKPATFPPSAHTQAASTISDSTTVGRAVLTAADAAAARTATGAAATSHTHAQSDVTSLTSDLALKAPLASPTFTGTPAAPTAAPGTNTTQLASTAYVTAAVAAGGGGGGSSIVVKRAQVTSAGNITPQSSPGAWAQFTGAPTLAIPAVVGNYVEFEILGMLWTPLSAFIDLAVIVGGSLVRFMATDTSTPGVEGAPAFYPQPSTFRHYGPVFDFVVASGDLSGGNVTVGFATKGNGTGTLYASTDYPLRWRAVNYGSVSVT